MVGGGETVAAARARAEEEYRRRTPSSRALHERALRYLPGGDTRAVTHFAPYPVYMDRGNGCRLTDVDGNVYLDLVGNYTSLVHGHAHPRIVEAVSAQLARGTAYGSAIESQIRLARALCERVPSLERVRFCNSGTEATLQAIRAAKAFSGRNRILKMEGGYHGTHDAVDVSAAPAPAAGPADAPRPVPSSEGLFRGVLADVLVAPFNNLDATARIIEEHGDDRAAGIVEPVLGGGGFVPARREYLTMLRELTRACGALLIFDEVLTFRLAHGGAQALYGVTPDLTTLGKLIGGGLPVGAFGGRADIMSLYDPASRRLQHSGTFNGNAATMVAGLVALELLTDVEIERINALGERLRAGFRKALEDAGLPGQVTGAGSLANFYLGDGPPVVDYRSARALRQSPLLPVVHLGLLKRGVFVASRGLMCVCTAMGEAEVDEAVTAFSDVVAELAQAAAVPA
ncbi:MAG: aspartate aminotransferase family protein [Gemmatimonadetes bacterium]|nr:aspartate aminotransferase family protein [Gemmatimonadota bacterium]